MERYLHKSFHENKEYYIEYPEFPLNSRLADVTLVHQKFYNFKEELQANQHNRIFES